MELLFKQCCEYIQSEEPCEETPKENQDNLDIAEYDYNKRLWF